MMELYEVIMTPDAVADLGELRDYIADVLLAPDTALSYVREIRAEISKLEYMASAFALLKEEPWHSRGVRRIVAKSFYVYIDLSCNELYENGVVI